MLYEYFTKRTQATVTGGKIGLEVETFFVDKNADPISRQVLRAILNTKSPEPELFDLAQELSQQTIEVRIQPQSSFLKAYEVMLEALSWSYKVAADNDAYPVFEPGFEYEDPLLWIQEQRDKVWLDLDGWKALEQLCRCASVQINVDVHPQDAIRIINQLLESRVQYQDFSENHKRWLMYICSSKAKYLPDRYGGPDRFDNLKDYVRQLNKHHVVMHRDKRVNLIAEETTDLDIDMFLRSIWWHYRLRVSKDGQTLYLEIRPFSRRTDENILNNWELIRGVFGL